MYGALNREKWNFLKSWTYMGWNGGLEKKSKQIICTEILHGKSLYKPTGGDGNMNGLSQTVYQSLLSLNSLFIASFS